MIPRTLELGRFVASTMTTTGLIRRVISVTADPLTGADIPTYADVYNGPCLVYDFDSVAQNPNVAGTTYTVTRYAVTVPVGTDVKVGDVFVASASPESPGLVGVQLRITDAPVGSWQVATTCTAERLT